MRSISNIKIRFTFYTPSKSHANLHLHASLQLCTKVKITNEDTKSKSMKELQLSQNRMLRAINNTRIKDKISIGSMLDKFQLLSVNQMAASIKLLEVWKSINVEGSPITLEPYAPKNNAGQSLRPRNNRIFNDSARMKIAESSFNVDAARLWNSCHVEIRNSTSLAEAKRLIKHFAKSLPI